MTSFNQPGLYEMTAHLVSPKMDNLFADTPGVSCRTMEWAAGNFGHHSPIYMDLAFALAKGFALSCGAVV